VKAVVGAEQAVRLIRWNVGHFDQHRNPLSTRGAGPPMVSAKVATAS
jgi:hypothetical protein